MLGNGRLEAKCQDGETRLGQIRGQMRKKVSPFTLRASGASEKCGMSVSMSGASERSGRVKGEERVRGVRVSRVKVREV